MDNESKTKVNWRGILIVLAIIIAFVGLFFITKVSVKATVVNKEEQIYEAASSINIQMDTRNRKIKQLTQVIEEYSDYERGIVKDFAEARKQLAEGSESAATVLNAISEQYPNLKADKQYLTLSNEIISCENKISDYREDYNYQVKSYRKYCRNPVNKFFLGNYKMVDESEYLKFDKNISDVGDVFWIKRVNVFYLNVIISL